MENSSSRRWGALVVLALFVVAGLVRFSSGVGDDLSASYIGCRLLAAGEGTHLYKHDPIDFSAIGPDDPWQEQADGGGFSGSLHPYVQTPLWAYGLRPLCTRMTFTGFQRVFAVLVMCCFASAVGLVAWFWARSLWNPGGMAVVLAGLWFSVPFQYAMGLMQTHVLFFLMALGALMLAERKRPGWAGLLLAGAAAVKLTPGVLVVYWLMTRRWKAAMWTVVWSIAMLGVTVLATGRGLVAEYLGEVHRISGVLLVAENNQSLAAWWMGRLYPAAAVTQMTMLALPGGLKVISLGLMVGFAVLGGAIDRRRGTGAVGAMMAMVAATVFAPIAWTHYSIVLVAPMMVLWQESVRERLRWVWGAMAVVVALNFPPLAADVPSWVVGPYSVLRSEFYAGVLCLALLWWVGRRQSTAIRMEAGARRIEVAVAG